MAMRRGTGAPPELHPPALFTNARSAPTRAATETSSRS